MNKKLIYALMAIVYTMILISVSSVFAESQSDILQTIAISNASGKLNISWINPASDNIEGIDVTDEKGISVVPDSVTLNKGNRAVNTFSLSGLDNEKQYIYIIRCMVDGIEQTAKVFGTPLSDASTTTLSHNGFDVGIPMTRKDTVGYFLDTNESASGMNSLKVVSNYGVSGNYGVVMEPNGWHTLEASKKYKLSFSTKLENYNQGAYTNSDKRFIKIRNGGTDLLQIPGISSGEGWKNYEIILENQTSLRLGMVVQTQATIWIDNVELYLLDDDGNTLGKNLITWGDFEIAVGNLNLDDGILSWEEPDNESYEGVNVFVEEENGNLKKINNEPIPKGTTSFIVPESEIREEGFKIVVAALINGVQMQGVSYSSVGKVIYYDSVLSLEGEVTESLKTGNILVSKGVQNNGMGEEFKVSLILTLYKDGEIMDMKIAEELIPQNEMITNIRENILIPGNGYELRVYLWDDIENMEILQIGKVYSN